MAYSFRISNCNVCRLSFKNWRKFPTVCCGHIRLGACHCVLVLASKSDRTRLEDDTVVLAIVDTKFTIGMRNDLVVGSMEDGQVTADDWVEGTGCALPKIVDGISPVCIGVLLSTRLSSDFSSSTSCTQFVRSDDGSCYA
jgi:hypothetical protein